MIIKDILRKNGQPLKEIDIRSFEVGESAEFIVGKYTRPITIKSTFPLYKWLLLFNNQEIYLSLNQSCYGIATSMVVTTGDKFTIKKVGETDRNGPKGPYKVGQFEFRLNDKVWRTFRKENTPIQIKVKDKTPPNTFEQSVLKQMVQARKERGEMSRDEFIDALVKQANFKKERAEELFDYFF